MPRQYVYACTRCHYKPHSNPDLARTMLTAKVTQFKEVGFRGRIIRSRVTDWLCYNCLETDKDYKLCDRSFNDRVAKDKVNGA